jgi:ribosomal peptide maturation radical SAM protein 1
MRLLFAVLPWHSLDYPCLAAGILHGLTKERNPEWAFEQRYLNVEWSDYLFKASEGEFTPSDYCLLSEQFVFSLAGEWVFSSALHEVDEHFPELYRSMFAGSDEQFEKIHFSHRHAYKFICDIADDIVDGGYDAVALSSTFTQNAACLALAKAIKKRNPKIITMMGGGNCDGVQGIALHRSFRCVDFVVRGEGEESFPLLLSAIVESAPERFDAVPGLCWWKADTQSVNDSATTEDMDGVPVPVYDDYFAQIEGASVRPFIEPVLVMETARGCWWGEKHHCTFCGLNGTGMKFRSKSQDRALEEVRTLVEKYQILDLVVADNILDLQYFKTFLPALVDSGWDLRIHYETKSNLKSSQIDLMRQAGITHVQPGIESLSSKVLALMDKGVTGARNVQSLRDCEEANLTVSWNYLLGFPGESDADYLHILEQIPDLVHLQPPSGATRMALERFSPHFEKPWMGFEERWPHPAYELVYKLPIEELQDFSFFFDSHDAGIDDELIARLQLAIDRWRDTYPGGASLHHDDEGDSVRIMDRRHPGQ